MERKLRLVPTAPPQQAGLPADGRPADDEAEITAGEREAAEALRAALDRGEAPEALALRAAFAPADIAADDLDAIVARALGDESASTGAERKAAARIRAELEGEAPLHDAAILGHLRLANNPPSLDPAKNEALIDAAFARAARLRRGVVRRLAPVTIATISGITALAAGIALFLGQPRLDPAADRAAAMIRARSADDLFDPSTPFPRSGEESARVDRIAAARGSDLRKNRFASWGVR